MSGRISWEKFQGHAKKLLKAGAPVCPCCLHPGLSFTTDDGHSEYWLECRACHMGVRSALFATVRTVWSRKQPKDPAMHKITHDISCEYWDDDTQQVLYVEPDGEHDAHERSEPMTEWIKTYNAAIVAVQDDNRTAVAWAMNDPMEYPLDGRGVAADGFRCDGADAWHAAMAALWDAAAHAKARNAGSLAASCYVDGDSAGRPLATKAVLDGMDMFTAAPDVPEDSPYDPASIRYRIAKERAEALLGQGAGENGSAPEEHESFVPEPGQYVLYANGGRLEVGRVKRVDAPGKAAYVWYSAGDTAARTPFDCLRPIVNQHAIRSALGGDDARAMFPEDGFGMMR